MMIDLYSVGSLRLGYGHQYRIEKISREAKSLGISSNIIRLDPIQKDTPKKNISTANVAIVDFINPSIFFKPYILDKYEKIYYLNDMGWSSLPKNFVSVPTQNIINFRVSSRNHQILFDPSASRGFIESTDFIEYYESKSHCMEYDNSAYIALGSNPRYIIFEDIAKLIRELHSNGIHQITLLLNKDHKNYLDFVNMKVDVVHKLDFMHLDLHKYIVTGGGFLKQEVACLNKKMAVYPINKHQDLLSMAFKRKLDVPVIWRRNINNVDFRRPSSLVQPQRGAKYILELASNKRSPVYQLERQEKIVYRK
tara:strand:- start:3150 stop:4076 length:927 start_codon:yes stop_codon:yes gene_type:complete